MANRIKLKIEHVLILAIILIGIYLLINRCSCNNGFSIGGKNEGDDCKNDKDCNNSEGNCQVIDCACDKEKGEKKGKCTSDPRSLFKGRDKVFIEVSEMVGHTILLKSHMNNTVKNLKRDFVIKRYEKEHNTLVEEEEKYARALENKIENDIESVHFILNNERLEDDKTLRDYNLVSKGNDRKNPYKITAIARESMGSELFRRLDKMVEERLILEIVSEKLKQLYSGRIHDKRDLLIRYFNQFEDNREFAEMLWKSNVANYKFD